MFSTLKTAALSAMIGLGALAALPSAASAEGLYLNFGGHGPSGGIYVDNHRGRDWNRGHDRWDRDRGPRHEARGCSAERALDKADRLGLRRARVVDVDRRTIRVVGRKWQDRVSVTFARAPGCPIVSRW